MRDISDFNMLKYRQENVGAEFCSFSSEDSSVECYFVSLGEQFPSFEDLLDVEDEGTVVL
jgi:hypothetical protein